MDVLGGRGAKPPRSGDVEYPIVKSVADLKSFSVMPSDHLNYAATWFTLSGATGLLAVKALRQAARR